MVIKFQRKFGIFFLKQIKNINEKFHLEKNKMITLNSHFTFSALHVSISSFYVCVCVCYSILRSAVYEVIWCQESNQSLTHAKKMLQYLQLFFFSLFKESISLVILLKAL